MSGKKEYWLEMSDDDVITAKAMLTAKRFLWVGFTCHLAVEKALKAVIAYNIDEIPPKIHDLPKLANLGGIFTELSEQQKGLLRRLMPLHIEARYPEYKEKIASALTKEYCEQILNETEEFICWIKQKLEK